MQSQGSAGANEFTIAKIDKAKQSPDYYPVVSTRRLSSAYDEYEPEEADEIEIRIHTQGGKINEEEDSLSQLDMSSIIVESDGQPPHERRVGWPIEKENMEETLRDLARLIGNLEIE